MTYQDKLEALLQQATIVTGTAVLGALAATAAGAATVDANGLRIVDINQTADNSSFAFDLNGDGVDDYEVSAFQNLKIKGDSERGVISPLKGFKQRASVFDDGQKLGGFALRFEEGDSIDETAGSGFGQGATLFNGAQGPFATVGDTGFIGLLLVLLEDGEENAHFGWAEVERGSLSVLRIGFQTNANTAAEIPGLDDDVAAIPLPASLPLLLAGAGGLLALRRRRTALAA